jgi:hypothetical protein
MPYRGPGVDHTYLSPSGRVSKRAREEATRRTAEALFGPNSGFQGWGEVKQPSERARLLRQAAELRDLAARGMHPRKYPKIAAALEARAAALPEDD